MRGFAAGGPTTRYVVLNLGHHGQGPWHVNDTQRNMSASVVHEVHDDAEQTAKWLNDRWRGYASLRQFEHGANWPHFPFPNDRVKCSGCEGATWGHRNGVANGYA